MQRSIVLALAAFGTASASSGSTKLDKYFDVLKSPEHREIASKQMASTMDALKTLKESKGAEIQTKQPLEKPGAPALRSLAACSPSSSECAEIYTAVSVESVADLCAAYDTYGEECADDCFGSGFGVGEVFGLGCNCDEGILEDFLFGGSFSYSMSMSYSYSMSDDLLSGITEFCDEACMDSVLGFYEYALGSYLFSFDYCEAKKDTAEYEGCSYSGTCYGGNDDDDDVCFSGDSNIQLASGATKAMADLEVGDSVLSADASGKLSFSDVVFLPHGTNSKKAEFVAVTTESGKIVKATPSHLLQACDGSLVQAKTASCLRTVDGAEFVKSINRFKAEGIYTAVTLKNEFLVVDGVVASPFAMAHTLTDAYYNAHRALYAVSPSLVKVPSMVSVNSLVGAAAVYVMRSLRSLHQGAKSVVFWK